MPASVNANDVGGWGTVELKFMFFQVSEINHCFSNRIVNSSNARTNYASLKTLPVALHKVALGNAQ